MSAASTSLEGQPLPRSPLLMSRRDSGLLVVDMQERLLPVIRGAADLRWNIRRLLDGAELLGVPCWATEQYPQRLGTTVPELSSKLPQPSAKLSFSGGGCVDFVERQLRPARVDKVLVVGIETHVCILQTVFDLLTEGYQVYVAVDGVGTRHAVDHDWALRRMESSGVTMTTIETVLFEWCEVAGTEEFRQISRLVREARSSPSGGDA